jgi:hypothetical protein
MIAAAGAAIGREETKMLKNKIYYRSAFDWKKCLNSAKMKKIRINSCH